MELMRKLPLPPIMKTKLTILILFLSLTFSMACSQSTKEIEGLIVNGWHKKSKWR